MESLRVLLLDLDGTVREPASGAKFINKSEDQRIIEGVEQVIARHKDWAIIGITNQGGVAAGHKTLLEAMEEQRVTLRLLPQLSSIYMCPSYEGLECWEVTRSGAYIKPRGDYGGYRKPNPGMLKLAIEALEAELEEEAVEILYVGDRPEDEQAARAAGVPFMWADEWRTRALVCNI